MILDNLIVFIVDSDEFSECVVLRRDRSREVSNPIANARGDSCEQGAVPSPGAPSMDPVFVELELEEEVVKALIISHAELSDV